LKEEQKKKGAAVRAPAKKETTVGVDIGCYKITPGSGTLVPGSSISIETIFTASGSKLLLKTLAIDISGRDPNDFPKGIPYDLAGESCIPGINTTELDSIFEEQTVVPSLEYMASQQILSANVFA
jgi:hydrocephalus-inducing protein